MGRDTPEDREYLILKTIENYEGIGPTQLHLKTQIPKKTLYKYLRELEKNKVIIKKKNGKKPNSSVSYTVAFLEEDKKAIKHTLGNLRGHPEYYGTKIGKSNNFPHYLQELAAEFYLYMMHYFFHSIPSYKFAMKQFEEILEEQKKILDKEFKGKNLHRLGEACESVYNALYGNAMESMSAAASRNNHRSNDEILLDFTNIRPLGMSTQHEYIQKNRNKLKSSSILEISRVDYIKDKKTKKKFIELADEYDELARKLDIIKIKLTSITGAYSIKPPNVDKNSDFF